MRSNLISLQNISKLQDQTQLRLSTGLKVNSAIDNPSSYYAAQSLSNRAGDLRSLLDAMGQGIQTIKAANEGIETAGELLDQMTAVSEQASVGGLSKVPEKEYFANKVGSNGAVVSTADELRAAISAGKETICVYGQIDLGDISTAGGLTLKENQKLVGVEYFGNYSDGEGFSGISANSTAVRSLIYISQDNCLVSDLSINFENIATSGSSYALIVSGGDITADLQNLNIKTDFNDNNTHTKAAIAIQNGTNVNLQKSIKIEISGINGHGIYVTNSSSVNIVSDAQVNILTSKQNGTGIFGTTNSKIDIQLGAQVIIQTLGQSGRGIYVYGNSVANIAGNLQILTTGSNAYGICISSQSGNQVNILDTAQIYLNTGTSAAFYNEKNDGTNGPNVFNFAKGAKVGFEKDGVKSWYQINEYYKDETDTTGNHNITADNFATTVKTAGVSAAWQTPTDIIAQEQEKLAQKAAEEQARLAGYQNQYNNILSQYDMLIKDSSYKGINLLETDRLKINFNEDKSSKVMVEGVDVTSKSLGLQTTEWLTQDDVQKSLEQITNAKNVLRSAASQLGNYYSIITTREDFTNKLINVLEEGADKLTLADMNEESANMLALQTRQSLAINSLSLASQANQAILKLF